MKKITSVFTAILILLLSSCSVVFYNFDFKAPEFESYKIEDIDFEDYIPSNINEPSNLEELINEYAVIANIQIKNISFNDKWFFTDKSVYTGSGVIFYDNDTYYYALTNHHVVEKDRDYNLNIIEVKDYYNNVYDGFIYEGSLNEDLDVAIVVFEKQDKELTVLDLVDGRIEIGHSIIAIGNPLGKPNVISYGIVKKYNKTITTNRYDEEIQRDFYSIIHSASTNSGSSGGMLINLDLKIVGINFAGSSDEDEKEAFAIPSYIIVELLIELINEV